MKGIPLTEFQLLAGLSDGALLWLLKEGALPCSCAADGRINVNLDALQTAKLAHTLVKRRAASRPSHYEDLVEECGEILTRRIGELASEVLASVAVRGG